MTTTKRDIVKRIAEAIDEPQTRTKEIVRLVLEAIADTTLEDGRVELRDFGIFEIQQRKARKARNPRTGDDIAVPATAVVTFKPAKKIRDRAHRAVTRDAEPTAEAV